MRNELDEKLKKTLGSPHPLDIEIFTNKVMEHLREQLKREEQHLSLGKCFRRLIVFYRGCLKAVFLGHLPQAEQNKPFARRYSPVFKITAGLAAVTVVIILTLIFIPNYGPSTSPKTFEFSEMLNNTLPCYVLNDQANIHIMETRPCDILPPLLD